jgi:hypothetical protein
MTNPFCLVDDLIEPLRPYLDRHVMTSPDSVSGELNPASKRRILDFLLLGFDSGVTCSHACQDYALSARSYIAGETDLLRIPCLEPAE